MRLTIKLAAYAIVLTIATVVVFAGPCEDSCNFNNDACTGAANTAYSQCSTAVQNEITQCYQQADQTWMWCHIGASYEFYVCLQNAAPEEEGICNSLLQMAQNSCDNGQQQDYYYCMVNTGVGQEQCESNFQMDQQACANDYDNCLFICSTQNP
jgi:hypothetical protein